ncbi:MAG: hypothetical protein U0Q19_03715 [Kineosporiaceae bacterium]
MLLCLDDVQWIDPGTARVLARLADVLDGAPLLVLATARNDADSLAATELVVSSLGEAVGLDLEGPLDEVGVAELVAAMLPGLEAGHRLAQLVAVRSGGSPFVVQEYVRAIVDAGLLRPSWGSWLLDEDELDAWNCPGMPLASSARWPPWESRRGAAGHRSRGPGPVQPAGAGGCRPLGSAEMVLDAVVDAPARRPARVPGTRRARLRGTPDPAGAARGRQQAEATAQPHAGDR